MPNNYIIGTELDTDEVMNRKLVEGEDKIKTIANQINVKKSGVYDVYEGSIAGLKSGFAPLLFRAFFSSTRSFYTENTCNKCGKCVKVCPTKNIVVSDKVEWGKDCTTCLACLHYCPIKAIQRGNGTKNKGRYVNPNCRVEYNFNN